MRLQGRLRLISRPLLARSLAWMVAVWIVHAILRFAVLARPDAFGAPMVGKVDWYFFHAICFDARWIAISSLPFIAHVAFWEHRRRWFAHVGHAAFGVFHGVLLVLTVIDHEMQRFMGSHLTVTLIETYGNASSLAPLWTFLNDDRGGRFLPLVLLIGSVNAAFWIAVWLRKLRWFGDDPRWGRISIATILFVAVGWIYTEVLWGGYNRARKLDPVLSVWWRSWKAGRDADLSPADFATFTREFRERWRREAGGDTLWNFPDPELPYWKVPRGGEWTASPESSWNVVLVVMESHRAANAGFMKPWGSDRDGTPFLDSIAPNADIWPEFHVSALPTVRALTSIHLGILNHPDRNIVTDYPTLHNRAFSAILGEKGWTTRFFSTADPAWDNQTPWLRRWYQEFDYSRFRETDARMFAHASRWMRDSLREGSPFLVTLMTKSNHYPFNPPDDMPSASASTDLQDRMVETMRYTERNLAAFVDSLRTEPWFSRTVFVFTGDHGFPLGEHACTSIGCGLFDESTRVPLVIWGSHPTLHAGRIHAGPATQVDLGPTILGLAGVRVANEFVGNDLLFSDSTPSRLRVTDNFQELLVREGGVSVHGSLEPEAPRLNGNEAFATGSDPRERKDVWSSAPVRFDSLLEIGRRESRLLGAVLHRNVVAPEPW